MPGASGGVVRSVVVRLTSEVSGLVRGYRTVEAEGDKLRDGVKKTTDESKKLEASLLGNTKESKKLRESLGQVGKVAGAVGLAAALGLGVAVNKAADFEQGMSDVDAATHASIETLGQYREAAIEAGESTQYSATESAGAIENLAKAGVGARDILRGGLSGSLNLAAAGNLEVANAAEIAATALTTFSLNGREMSHVADLLAAGAGKAQGEVGDLSQALQQVGLVAAQSGMGIEETIATLSAFASKGLLGSDAGTSLKTFLLQLVPSTTAAYDAMAAYGLVAYDANEASKALAKDGLTAASNSYEDVFRAVSKWLVAQGVAGEGTAKLAKKTQEYLQRMGLLHSQFTESNGDFKSMADIAGVLEEKLGKLSTSERQAALKKIFGTDAVRAANVLFEQGTRGMRKWENAVDDAGYAAETARRRTDNLRGDVERLGGALDTALIGTGTGAQGPLREATQSITDLIDRYNDLSPAAQEATLRAAGLVAVVGGGTFILTRAVTGFVAMREAVVALGIAEQATATRTLLLRGAAGATGAALLLFSGHIGETNKELGLLASAGGGALLGFAAGGPIGAAIGAGAGLLYGMESATDASAEAFERHRASARNFTDALRAANGEIDRNVRAQALKSLQDTAALRAAGALGIPTRDLVGTVIGNEGARKRVDEAIRESLKLGTMMTYKNGGQGLAGTALAQALYGTGDAATDAKLGVQGLTSAFSKSRREVLAEIDSLKTWRQALKGIPKKVFTRLENLGFAPTFDQVLRLQRQYKLTPKQVNTIFRETGVGVTNQQVLELQRRMDLTPREVVTLVKATGVTLTAQQVEGLQRRYDMTPKEKRTFFKALGLDEAGASVERFQRKILNLHGKTVTIRVDQQYGQTAQVGQQPGKLLAGRAYGGPMAAYQDHWVGENGPEVVRTMLPARVIPNNQLRGNPVVTGRGFGGGSSDRLSDHDVSRIVGMLRETRPLYGEVSVYGDNSFERAQRERAAVGLPLH